MGWDKETTSSVRHRIAVAETKRGEANIGSPTWSMNASVNWLPAGLKQSMVFPFKSCMWVSKTSRNTDRSIEACPECCWSAHLRNTMHEDIWIEQSHFQLDTHGNRLHTWSCKRQLTTWIIVNQCASSWFCDDARAQSTSKEDHVFPADAGGEDKNDASEENESHHKKPAWVSKSNMIGAV